MEFSVNISEIYNQLNILQEEKKTTDALISCIKTKIRENAETMMLDPALLQKQLHLAQKLSANILRRIQFLESSAQEFEMLKRTSNSIFSDALDFASIVNPE